MAIIYSYPIVDPSANDLVLGSDVDSAGKPTKNFTVQSIIDLVTVTGNDLQAVLDNGNTATGKDIIITSNIIINYHFQLLIFVLNDFIRYKIRFKFIQFIFVILIFIIKCCVFKNTFNRVSNKVFRYRDNKR